MQQYGFTTKINIFKGRNARFKKLYSSISQCFWPSKVVVANMLASVDNQQTQSNITIGCASGHLT